jgi:hypothetical protein
MADVFGFDANTVNDMTSLQIMAYLESKQGESKEGGWTQFGGERVGDRLHFPTTEAAKDYFAWRKRQREQEAE